MNKYKVLTDSNLVSLLKQRDRNAFAEIYDRYSMMIYYKVNQMLRDENAAKDLVQDLFTSIWEKSDFIRDNVGISSYLYVASRNRVLNYIQKGKTKSDYLAEIGKYSLQVSDETLEKLDEKDLMLLITSEIAKLPAKMREVFELSRLEDLSHREIAERLNLSESTVKKQVQNALKILKVRLTHYNSLGIMLLIFLRSN
ncbi:RNA polymerase sigma factor [Sphingobacterium sp. BIGb0165]|uniref:RNA polymerase sigma factor n=1 Tax=Sphingobacterium sp. BIGb0165 TaxID=2940615 RepID=UPI002169DE1D|nr:RNA polymerase sigma-70 factor [Sphingobacterium sp. BIGb0165]MCS4226994.1 RNA polymerase sigma-70 factor (ECF subfamily) [Sphingobacterium sp. BIGb0165]